MLDQFLHHSSGNLTKAKVLLPLTNLCMSFESEVVGLFRELEHHNIYYPLGIVGLSQGQGVDKWLERRWEVGEGS